MGASRPGSAERRHPRREGAARREVPRARLDCASLRLCAAPRRGGASAEPLSIAQAYVPPRQRHGDSELLDEIVAARPELDHTRYHSAEELKEHGLQHL